MQTEWVSTDYDYSWWLDKSALARKFVMQMEKSFA